MVKQKNNGKVENGGRTTIGDKWEPIVESNIGNWAKHGYRKYLTKNLAYKVQGQMTCQSPLPLRHTIAYITEKAKCNVAYLIVIKLTFYCILSLTSFLCNKIDQ